MDTLLKIFSDQTNRIIERKYHIIADLTETDFVNRYINPLKQLLVSSNIETELRENRIPFILVLPHNFVSLSYQLEGIRKITKIKERPLLGTIVKPKVGLNEVEHAKVCGNAWKGGLDIVKDDENLTSMIFNRFEKRILETYPWQILVVS